MGGKQVCVMSRNRVRKTSLSIFRAAWLWLALAVLLVGCQEAAPHVISASTNACSLVNAPQFGQVVNMPVTMKPSPLKLAKPINAVASMSQCNYQSSDGTLSASLLIEVFHTPQ